MAASNCETLRGWYLSHSDPASKIQIWEDVSSPTSSVMCLLDSAVSDSRSVSCHTFKKIYYPAPKFDTASDVSLESNYIRQLSVVRIRNNIRSPGALSIACGPKILSVSKTAQELINELERDPGSSHASAVYPKRRSKVHKISTSSITIDDTGLYCVSENSEDPCSGSKKSEPENGSNRPAGVIKGCTTSKISKTSSDDSETEVCCNPKPSTPEESEHSEDEEPESASEPEPALKNATSNPIRPGHVHSRARRRKCHSHSWTKPACKTKSQTLLTKLSNTLTSKLQQVLDSGARMASHHPYHGAKCNGKKSYTKQAENAAPNPTGPECDLSCIGPLCPPGKNPSQAAEAGVLNPASTITQQESEKAKVKIQSEKSNVNGTDLTPMPITGGCKTPDIQPSGVCSLNPKVQCECHAKKCPDPPVAVPCKFETRPEGCKTPDIQGSGFCSLNPKVQCECHAKKCPDPPVAVPCKFETRPEGCKTPDIQRSGVCSLNPKVQCECHAKKCPDPPVAVPCKFETRPEGCKAPDIQRSGVCSLNPKVQCECHAKKCPDPPVAVPCKFETRPEGCKTPDVQRSGVCSLNPKVQCECHAKKCPDPPVAVPCKFETRPGDCKTPVVQASGVCSLNPKVQCECHGQAETPNSELKGPAQTPEPDLNGPAQTPKPVAVPCKFETCPEGYKPPDIQPLAACPLNTQVPCECHVKGTHQMPDEFGTCPGGCKAPEIQSPAASILDSKASCECYLKDAGLTSESEASPHEWPPIPCECHVKGPDQTSKPVAVPSEFGTFKGGCKAPEIQSPAASILDSKASCECYPKDARLISESEASPHEFETYAGGCRVETLDIKTVASCQLNSKVSCECYVKGSDQTPKPELGTCAGGYKAPEIQSPAAFILDSKASCECCLKDAGLTSESEASPHEFETCAGDKVSCECYVKGSDQTPKRELGTCPGGCKGPRCPGPAICKHQKPEPHMTSPGSLEITTNEPQIPATRHIAEPSKCPVLGPVLSKHQVSETKAKTPDIRSSAACPLNSKASCECHVKGTHQIPDEFGTCPGGCKVPEIQSPAAFILDSKASCECYPKDAGLTSESEASPHELETCAGDKVSCECYVKGSDQTAKRELGTCPGGCKGPRCPGPVICKHQKPEPHMTSPESLEITTNEPQIPATRHIAEPSKCPVLGPVLSRHQVSETKAKTPDIQSSATCPLNSKASCECHVKDAHQIPDEFGTCPGGCKVPEIQSPAAFISDSKASCECYPKDAGLTSELEAAPHEFETCAGGCRGTLDIQTVASCQLSSKVSCVKGSDQTPKPELEICPGGCRVTGPHLSSAKGSHSSHHQSKKHSSGPEHHNTKHHSWKHHHSTDSGLTDTSIDLGKSKRSTGTQSEKSNLTLPDGIRSCSAKYKISGIQLELIGFTGSNAVLNIRSNIAAEGSKGNASSVCGTAQNSCCPCPPSIRSGLAASNEEKRKVSSDIQPLAACPLNTQVPCECDVKGTDQTSSAKTSNGADIKNTCSEPTEQPMDGASHAAAVEIHKIEETASIRKGSTSSVKFMETEDKNITICDHGKKGGKHHAKREDSEGVHSSCCKRSKKRGKRHAKTKESKEEHESETRVERLKGFLASCWPYKLLLGHPKKEASVGDEHMTTDHKGVEFNCDEYPPVKTLRCETSQLRVNSQISHQISSQSFDSYNKSQASKNRDMFLHASAELGSPYQSQTNKSTSFLDTGPTKDRTTPIISGANICCAFQDTEMNKIRSAAITGCANPSCRNPSCPFPVTKSCGAQCCSSQDSESSKSQTTTIKLCSNPMCPFEDALIKPNQISIPNTDCQIGDPSINKHHATDNATSPCFPFEGIPTNEKPIHTHSSCCKSCCRSNYSKSTNNFAKICCANTSTNMRHLCCCDSKVIKTGSDKDLLTMANQNNLKLYTMYKKRASERSLTKKEKEKLSSSIGARNVITQYSSTYLNYCSKGIPVQKSLSQPIRCQCTVNPIRSSAPSVDERMSQKLIMSVLSAEIAPYCMYCGQTTRVQENHGHVESQGPPPPLPRAVCQDPSCPANKQHSHKENAHPAHRANTTNFGQTCNLMKKKGLDVECLCAGYENEDNDKPTQTEPLEQRGNTTDRHGSGVQFAVIPRGSKPSDFTTQQGDYVTPHITSAIQDAVPTTCCCANSKSNVSCECALFAQEYCQADRQGHCLGRVSQTTHTEFPCGETCTQKAIALGCTEHVTKKKKKHKPPKPAKSNVSCECALFAQEYCQADRQGHCLGRVSQTTHTEFPCGETCTQKAIALGCAEHVTKKEKKHKPPKPAKSNVSCECALFAQEYCQADRQGHCLGRVSQTTHTEFPCGETCAQKAIALGCEEHVTKKKKKHKPPKLPCGPTQLPCGTICLPKQRSHSSESSAAKSGSCGTASITKVAKPSKPPRKPKKPKAQLSCISICSIELPKPIKTKPLCDDICQHKLAGHGTGLTISINGSCSCSENPAPPAKSSKRKKKLKKSDFPCGNICLQKIPTSSSATVAATCSCSSEVKKGKPSKHPKDAQSPGTEASDSAVGIKPVIKSFESSTSASGSGIYIKFEPYSPGMPAQAEEPRSNPTKHAKKSKKRKTPKAKDFPCGSICLNKLTSGSSASAVYVASQLTTTPSKPANPPKQAKQPKAKDFPCSASITVKPPKQSKGSASSSNSICSQLTPCGSAYNSANSKTSSKTKVAKQVKPAKYAEPAKRPKVLEICFEKPTPCSSTSSSAISKTSSKTKAAKPAESARNPKLTDGADFLCKKIWLQKVTSSSNAFSAGISKSSSARSSASAENKVKPVFSSNSMCLQVTYYSGNSENNGKTKVGKQTKPAKSSKAAKQPKAADFPCGNICLQKLTPSASDSSLDSKSGSNTTAKAMKPAKPSKQKTADFPCGNICSQKQTTSGNAASAAKSRKTNNKKEIIPCGSASSSGTSKSSSNSKPAKSAKQPKAADFPCGNICLQKQTPSGSAPGSASSSKTKVAKSEKQVTSQKNEKEIIPCGSASSSGTSKSSSKSKSAKQPKAADFPCGNICLQKQTPSGSAPGSASSSKTKVAKSEKQVTSQKNEKEIIPCGSASSSGTSKSSSKSKSAKQPKAADFPCGNIRLQKQTPSGSAPGSASSSKTKVAKPAKQAKPPENEKEIIHCGSASSLAVNIEKPKKEILPCGNAFSLTSPSASLAKLEKNKSSKHPKAGKGANLSCKCSPNASPCGSATNLKAKPPKSPKPDKKAKSPCVCPPTITLCSSALGLTATPPKSLKAKKGRNTPCNCPLTSTPCASASNLPITAKPPKSPKPGKKGKSPCVCPPTVTPCTSALGLTKTGTSPKPPNATKGGKSPCNCPPTSTPCASASNLPITAKPPKSSKAKSKPPCVCPSSITPCASSTIATPPKSPKSAKSAKSPCVCPPTVTPCAIASSVTTSGKPPKSAKPPKPPEGKKGAKSPCVCPPNMSPCGSGQLTPGRPRTPVKLMKAKSYKRNQEGVISLEEYEKNKKKRKKTKLMNTDICVPTCQAGCSKDNLQKQVPVVVPESKKSKKRDKWLGIFPCNRQCLSPKSVVPRQSPASERKGGKKYIDCTLSSLSGQRKSLKSIVPCECPAAVPTSKRSRVSCECPDSTGQGSKNKVGPKSPAIPSFPPYEEPLNQGIKVQIRKKMY